MPPDLVGHAADRLGDAELEALRQVGDRDADGLLESDERPAPSRSGGRPVPEQEGAREPGREADRAARGARDEPGGSLGALIGSLRRTRGDRPEWVERFVEDQALPGWARRQAIDAGQQFFDEWDLEIATALFCASLPFAYAAAKGVEVLELTSELARSATVARRIGETGQLLLDVTEHRGLDPGSPGHARLREIRLLHAAIRSTILEAEGPAWLVDDLGVPVNQEDLLGTLLSFTIVVFDALERLGLRVEDHQREHYLHLWGVIGFHLGIEEAQRTTDPTEARALTALLARRLHGESESGRHLMRVLLHEMEISMPWGLRKLPRTLVRMLAGDELADLLDVPAGAPWRPLLEWVAGATRAIEGLPGGDALLRAPSRMLGRSMIRMWDDRAVSHEQAPIRFDQVLRSGGSLARLVGRTSLGPRGRARRLRYQVRRVQLGQNA